MTPDDVMEDLGQLWSSPEALRMKGPNPIAPSCPQSGIFAISQWAWTTRGMSWAQGCAPEGWGVLQEAEEAGEEVAFVVFWDRPPALHHQRMCLAQGVLAQGFCVRLSDAGCHEALYSRPSRDRLEDLAQEYGDMACGFTK